MSHDVISDALNQIMNAKKAKKSSIIVKTYSTLLLEVLEVAKKHGYIESAIVKDRKLEIKFNLNKCKTIKPRYTVKSKDMERYVRRYLPARNFGIIIISTSKGLMTQYEAEEMKLGGSLIAYFY